MHTFDDFGFRGRLVGLDRRTVVVRPGSTSSPAHQSAGSAAGR